MKWWGWGAENKFPDVSNMPKFLPYVKELLGCNTNNRKSPISLDEIELNPVVENKAFIEHITLNFKPHQVKQDKYSRLIRAYGKSYRDLARIRQGLIPRAPDLILYPETNQDVRFLMDAALKYNVCLIPFGGGTNIVGALEVPSGEKRMVISVDMSRMNQVLSLDPIALTATIQAGAFGPEIEYQLNQQGYSLGHFPDSFEFSTLGGWLATRSVGMQSDQYGSISDMTLGIHCMTFDGYLQVPPHPHASMGLNLNEVLLGSEGRFGIITEAVMKIHPLPTEQHFAALVFPTFSAGIEAIKECATTHKLPHMMRLLDADETQLSVHFKSQKSKWEQWLETIMKRGITKFKKIDFSSCSIAIIAFAGTKKQMKQQRREVLTLCKKYGAFHLGQAPGKEWYKRKYDYPYLRDLMMDLGCVVDVAETSVLWGDVESFHQIIKKVGYDAMSSCIPENVLKNTKTPGYLGCHLSHHYQNGTCLYFTFAFTPKLGQEINQYSYVKETITEAIVNNKGSLSHHHSIGYEHAKWLPQVLGDTGVDLINKIKKSFDPGGQLNPKAGLGLPTEQVLNTPKTVVA
jgi:alkyldihydroxyacetonephosphate synthase